MPGRVWGAIHDAFGDVWWDGTNDSGGVITPPDSDSWYDGDGLPVVTQAWIAGGADGHRHFHVAIDSTLQWWVSVFNRAMTALLDRWEITGWVSANATAGVEGFLDIQHLCANSTCVVVIADHIDATAFHDSIDVTVFDLTGTILYQWSVATPAGFASLLQFTGSCTDGAYVYFGWTNDAGDDTIAKIELSTGTLTDLTTIDDIDTQVPSAIFGTGVGRGIVVHDGDLIIAGTYGIVRIEQDGTVVWWADITDPAEEYRSLAHSGNGSVWSSFDTTTTADEWDYDGNFRRTIAIPEETIQGWFIPGGPFEYRYRWPQIGPILTNPVAANLLNERDIELEDYLGDFEYPSRWPDLIAGLTRGDREPVGALEECDVALEDHLGDFEYPYRWADIMPGLLRGDSRAWALLELRDIMLEDHLSV